MINTLQVLFFFTFKFYNKINMLAYNYLQRTKKIFFFQLDVRWEMIACGKTENQLRLTEQARQFVSQTTALKPRSLNL